MTFPPQNPFDAPEKQDTYAQYCDFCTLAQQQDIIFYYSGYFSQNIIAAMAEAIRVRLEQSGTAVPTRRRLFSAFVEMAQNIIHYSADALTPPDQTDRELRQGSVCIGLAGERYFLLCANPVEDAVAVQLQAKLVALRTMNLEEIKTAYREMLRTEADSTSKGAGLGFLTMARDASEPLAFEFKPGTTPGKTMFYLKATI